MNNDNLKGLHGTLIKEGYNPPEYEQFAKDMEDETNLQGVYETLKREGYTPPSYDIFKEDMGFAAQPDRSSGMPESSGKPAGGLVPEIVTQDGTAPVVEQGLVDAAQAGANFIQRRIDQPKLENTPGTDEWRSRTVDVPGQNPYNGQTYGSVYDQIIQDYGKDLSHPDTDPYAEARAKIMQAGITDDMRPDEADSLALQIRDGYANLYAGNGARSLVSSLPDQVQDIDGLMDGIWYNRDLQGQIAHEARRLGLRQENYVNYFVKPQLAKALSDRYGYDVESAKHIANRLFSNEAHTMERVRQNEAASMIGKYAAPQIQQYFDAAMRNADSKFRGEAEGSAMTPYGNAGQLMGASIRHWQESDPAKIWEQLKPDIEQMGMSLVNDPEFFAEAMDHADEEGVETTQWIEKRILPMLESQIKSQFEQMAIEREMPKNTMEYIWANIQQSLVGTLARAALESQARSRMKTEALQRTETGQNADYTPSFGARIAGGAAAMLPDMALPYGGPFGLTAKMATKPVQGMSQRLIADGMRPLAARMIQSSAGGSLSLGAFEGLKGGVEGGFTPIDQESYLEDNRSAEDVLKDVVKGIWEKGVPSAVTGSTMIGGPVGQKISNGRGVLANALGWGAQVGIDAAGATALSTIPKIASGGVNWDEVGTEFASNVGTFAALGLHSKAREFASLANGGRAWNGVPFSKEDIQILEDRYLSPLRKQIEELESTQKNRGLISERAIGIDADEIQREAVGSAGAIMYEDMMHSYAIPRELKVKVAQALGVEIPVYALKPEVIELERQATEKAIELGWTDAMDYDYNKPGGVADKVRSGQPLNDSELTLRLIYQDNGAFNEAVRKQQSGEPLSEQERELVSTYQSRLNQMLTEYSREESGRLAHLFEEEHGLKPGALMQMMRDAADGKPVNSNLLNEYETMLRDYNQQLDAAKSARQFEQQAAQTGGTPAVEETPAVETSAEDAPKVNMVAGNEAGEKAVGNQAARNNPNTPPVNQATGTVMEVQTIDGRKAYVVDGDPTDPEGLVSLVDEQGNPVKLTDKSGYTIDRFPSSYIQADKNGRPSINESKPDAVKPESVIKPAEENPITETATVETVPAMSRIKVSEEGEPVWEESAPEDTAAALIEDQGSIDEAGVLVDEEVADLQNRLNELTAPDKGKNKHSNMNERRKKKEEIRQVQKKLDYWTGVKELIDNEREIKDGQVVDQLHSGGEADGNGQAGQVEIQGQGAEGKTGADTQQPKVEGAETGTGVPSVSAADVSGGAPPVETSEPVEPSAEQKIAQGTVKNNIGRRFEFQNHDGTRSEVVVNSFKGDNQVEVTRQDYDANGQPKGDPYKQELDMVTVGNSITNKYLKPVLSTEERLRNAFKGKVGVQNVIDVLSDAEQKQLLDAYDSGSGDAVSTMLNDFVEAHREDIILNDRNKRNQNISRIMDSTASREEKLRRVRKEYQGFDDAVISLSDEAMQPTTLEEYVAELHSRQPKSGEGPLAYFSYDRDGVETVGMQDETGHGAKSGGDTKAYSPWLAPKGKGMSLQKYAEQIRSQLPESIQEQYSDQDVRNAILSVFGGAERPSDITAMIVKRGVLQAEQAARRMEEMWIDGVGYQKVSPDDNSFAGRLTRAKQQTNTEPSEGQKEAGNYKKGHISFGGYDFVVENPEGSFRRGKDKTGRSWEQQMHNTYGYILGKKGKDGDHLDMFINDAQDLDSWNGKVYVIDQVDPGTGKFDEHKILYGFNSEAEARDAYLSNYEDGWKGLGRITGVDKDTFDKWLDSSDRKIKEFAEHSITRDALARQEPGEKKPVTDAEIDKALMNEVMKEPASKGVEFITDTDEGQRVLDEANGSTQAANDSEKKIKEQRVYHGSGADFDAFDHSHMGEGAGSQTFGYGTYVTNSKRIGTEYANVTSRGWLYKGMDGKELRASNDEVPEGRYYSDNEIRSFVLDYMNAGSSFEQAVDKVRRDTQSAINDHEEHLSELSPSELKDLEGFRQELELINSFKPEDFKRDGRYLYDVEIPNGNEAYYIDYYGKMGEQKNLLDMVDSALTADGWKRQEIDSRIKFTKGDKQVILTPNQSGADLYAELEDALGSDKAASEFLHKTGITGIKYPAGTIMGGGDGATNYVIFNENDAKITDRTKFFKTPDGHAYGYTYKGKIYIDPRIATSETPIHEYGHLWAEMKRQTSPEEWNRIKDVLLNDRLIEPFIEKVRRDYPELEGREDDFVEEVLTQFSGRHGAEKLRKIAQEIKEELGGDATAETIAETAVRRVKSLLNEFWKGVCDLMGWQYTSAEDIADAVLRDMLNGVNPREQMKEAANGKLRSQAEIERTLMGVHNLSEEKLRKVLKQGGLANPSLAVIDTKNHMHTDYGSISLIPKASLIDARTGRNAGTFTADAWTPTYPTVEKRMSDKGQDKFWKDLRTLREEDGEMANFVRMAFDTWLDKETGQERLAYWYLKEKGMKPEMIRNKNPYGEDIVKRIDELTDNGNLEVSRLSEEQIKEVADMYHAYKESIGEPVTPAEERIKKLQERMNPEKPSPFLKLQQFRLDELAKYGELLHNLNEFEYAVRRSADSDGKPNVEATVNNAQKVVKDQNLQQDFDKWLQDKADSYGIEEWLYNGTDDRTGKQKWVRNTLENASRLMKKEGLNGAVNWSSIGNWIAKVANKEKTLAGIRKNKKNLQTSEEEHEAFREKWSQVMYDIATKLGKGDSWSGENIMSDILDHKDYAGYLKREYGMELSKEDREAIDTFINEVQTSYPTGYFETKFERPVMLDEFEIAVVPENTSPDIVEALKNAGLDVRTYDNTGTEEQKDANRTQATMDAVQGRDDIMFQMVGKDGAAEADRAEGNDDRSRNLTLAEESEKAGVDARAVKLATGWERGADGQWRYEIPDADADILSKYKAKVDEMKADGIAKPQPIIKLGELLGEDNGLFRYYPDLKKTDVLFSDTLPDGTAGSFDGTNIELNAKETSRFDGDDLNNENVYGTLLHEVQHAIQEKEGFAQGGSIQTSTTEDGINAIIEKKERQRADIKTRLDANNKILGDPEELKMSAELEGKTEKEVKDRLTETVDQQAAEYDTLGLQIDRLRHTKAPSMTDAKDLYHRLAGEVESRNVTERMGMTEEQRRQSLASETEDVPREDQVIIMGDNGDAASMGDGPETFVERQKRAEREKGVVRPGLANLSVEVYPAKKHSYTGNIADATKQAAKAAKQKYAPDGKPKILDYDNYGKKFKYSISGNAIDESLNPKQQGKSVNKGVHLALVEHLDDVIGKSIEVEEHPDYPKNEKGERDGSIVNPNALMHRFYGAIEFEGKTYRVMTLMREYKSPSNSDGPYAYEVQKIEVPNEETSSTANGVGSNKPEGVSYPLAKLLNNVEKSKDSGKYLLDESKKTQENENSSLKFSKVGSPEPEMTPEERQYWNQWDKAMRKWREQNAIPEDAQEPGEETPKQPDEDMMDYVMRIARHRIEKAKWQTAPKLEDYRQMRSDKDLVEAARENLQRYPDSQQAKMRMAAAEFQQIRSAMGRQKAYDKATVKAVTDFARDYMKMGFGDNMTRGEIERMLSSVKNATGAKDIRREIDNIMNILTDNYLRNLDQQVQKLSSIKELRQTAQGVEAQGKLELKGQRMIQAFREAREYRMTAEDIRERMAEVSEKMTRDDDEAPMWEQEYEGLSIALQYMENVEASRSEYGALDREYKDAVKNYRESGRSYAEQQQYLEELDKAMMQNKLERIGMFGDIIGRLQGNIAESIEGAKEFRDREKQRIKHIQDIANFDLAGKDMGAMREKGKGKAANFFLQPLATFEQMLKEFGSRNANGEGYLYDHFMRSWMDATDKAFVNEQNAKEELDKKAREMFGDEKFGLKSLKRLGETVSKDMLGRKVNRWSDLYQIIRNEDDFPGMDVEIIDQNEPKTFHLNQGNLLYIYMANKMNDGAMKLRKMGITEEDVEAIKDHLDPRLVQLGDWLQDDYLVKKRTEYNKVHERMFGAPMAAIDHYFPIKILGDARVQEQDVNVPDSETLPSTITGNIIKRRRNALPLDILHTDALSLAIEHVEDMERWAATAEWNKDINTLLSYTTFRNKVKNMKTIYGSGDALWNAFKDAAKMAAGTYDPSAKSGHVDKTISNIAKGVTAAKINFRVYTAFKQILSAPAFLHDVDLSKFVKNSANPYGSWKWAMENMPVFQKRWKSRQAGDTRLMDDPTDWKMWKNNVVQMATRMGMSPNALVDGVTCAVGARSIYESRLKKYKDMGMAEADAEKRALQDAEIGYNLTQQSSEGAFVSAIQKDRTVAANMLSVFRNSSMAYTRQWVDAARNLKHKMQKGFRDDSIDFMARQFEDQLGLDEDKAREAAEKEYARSTRRDIARMLNMMFGVTVAWNLGASLPYLLIGDDNETKKEMMTDALLKGLLAGPSEGFAAGNLISELIGRSVASEETRKTFGKEGLGAAVDAAISQAGDYEINPLPLMADIQGMIKKMGYDKFAAAQDVFNIAMQSAVGVNPQTFTDIWNAAMDYGNPSWMPFTDDSVGNNDLSNAKEIALFILRVMNAPTSSWRNKYIDELGMGADEAKNLSYDEMARRYANYKHWKDSPFMGWLRGDEARQKKMETIRKQFDKAVQERIGRLTDEGMQKTFDNTVDTSERKLLGKEAANRVDSEDVMASTTSKKDQVKKAVDIYAQHRSWQDLYEDLELIKAQREAKALNNQLKELKSDADRFKTEDVDGSRKKAVEDFMKEHKALLDLQKDIDAVIKDIKKIRDKLTGMEDVDDGWKQIRSKRDEILKKIEATKQK